ncbi:hypothetical protein [Actinomycetospora aeridis]|uniref:Helicase ATP-binding domain-containing protein n=1 Tax=Actinomycetospora aeridis TaxID=3129231 RepID=A0ABU8N156_9PSEU
MTAVDSLAGVSTLGDPGSAASVAAGPSFSAFLAARRQLDAAGGFEPTAMPDHLFDFQRDLVQWAVRQGRAALFADCGLGKSPMALAWAENVLRHTGKPVLVLTPLAVSFQLEHEAGKFGHDAGTSRDGSVPAGITITNYERLEHFDTHRFGGVVCDESSALKAFDGKRRALVTEFLRTHQYRLLDTATAAPNDYTELGTSSEALGHLGFMDMLARFFTNAMHTSTHRVGWRRTHGAPAAMERQAYRLKGHAEDAFWRWVASWARAVRRPSDLGFSDDGYELPPLNERTHVIEATETREGALFDVPAQGLHEQREESRRTITERCEFAAQVLADADVAVAWCQLNDEGRLLTRLIDGAVEVSGSDPIDAKEEKLAAFGRGDIRCLVTKSSVGAWGLNWQHCHDTTVFPSHSWEQYYQLVHRFQRYGQQDPVTVHRIVTEGGRASLDSLERKAGQADRMFDALTAHMRDALTIRRSEEHPNAVEVPPWAS